MRIPTLISRSNGEYREVYVEDVFSTYVYTGTGAATRDITNGVDLDGKGGLVWTKCRSASYGNVLHDNEMSPETFLSSDISGGIYGGNTGADTYLSLNSDGYSIGDSQYVNESSREYTSWTFAKQEGFFDVVTYTGTGASQTIPHNLKSAPGMIIVKATNSNFDWVVYHKSMGDYANFYNEFGYLASSNSLYVKLNDTGSVTQSDIAWDNTDPTASGFTVGGDGRTGASGVEYVAYLFADDDPIFGTGEDESVIKCGGYTGNGSTTGPEIDLGWEPQWILIKGVNYSAAYDWKLYDAMRGIPVGTGDAVLQPNKSDIEETNQDNVDITPTGFKLTNAALATNRSGGGYIYMAIRRPMKPAEEFEPDELFAVEEDTGSVLPQFKSGFPVDFAFRRTTAFGGFSDTDTSARLIQGNNLKTNSYAAAETNDGSAYFDFQNGWRDSGADSPTPLSCMFRRAPGFFDVVTYAGTNSDLTVGHSLGVVPEMMWVKCTNNVRSWAALMPTIALSGSDYMQGYINTDSAFYNRSYSSPINYLASPPTDTTFELLGSTIGSNADVNNGGWNYIAYLWASVPGICDIGSYTGNGQGSGLQIDCGFTNGARFVLVKRTDEDEGGWDEGAHWMYWDTVRGQNYTASLNNNVQRFGTVWPPYAPGFQVNQYSANGDEWDPNVLNGKYIYMAIA
jgi:hypothetical protein